MNAPGDEAIVTPGEGRGDAADSERAFVCSQLVFDRMPLGCLLVNADLKVLEWNPAAEEIFGYRKAEALWRGIEELVVPEGVTSSWLATSVRRLGEGTESDVRVSEFRTKGGQAVSCEWHETPLRDASGRLIGILAMVRDVSDRVAAEAGLRKSRERLVRVLERLPIATAIVREDGHAEFFNRRAVELFGVEATASPTLTGLLLDLLPEGEERLTMERALDRMKASAASGAPGPAVLLSAQRRDGRKMVISAECVVVEDVVVWIASDLTDVLRLEAERARLGQIVEESLDEVYVFDASTLRFRSANRSARDNVGYSADQIQTLSPHDIEPELTPEAFARMVAPLREGASRGLRYETVHRRRDGTTYPVEVHLQISRQGDDPVFVTIVHDISTRRRAEQEIRALNTELEERVRARTSELEAANRELEAFTYSVSHDLRAPLRAMDGFSQLLLEDHGSALDDEGRRCIGRVRAGAQRMGRLVDDLLRLSRIARVELRLESVSLSALTSEIGAELVAAEPERRIVLTVEDGLTTRADRGLLRILLENLLSNAMKFTSRRAEAHIAVGREEERDGPVFFVRDDGAGFDMTYAGKLFRPFSRIHAPGEFEGTGIGLATVERIVRRHGGRVWAEGEVGRGATIRFALGNQD